MYAVIFSSPHLAEVLFLLAAIIFSVTAGLLFGKPLGGGLRRREPALAMLGLAALSFGLLAL